MADLSLERTGQETHSISDEQYCESVFFTGAGLGAAHSARDWHYYAIRLDLLSD